MSTVTFLASGASMFEFSRQIEDSKAFLETHELEFARLCRQTGIKEVGLDFGIAWRDVIVQCDYLPPDLIRIAGALGIGIEISHYPVDGNVDSSDEERTPDPETY
jgi:hypothetical protein